MVLGDIESGLLSEGSLIIVPYSEHNITQYTSTRKTKCPLQRHPYSEGPV